MRSVTLVALLALFTAAFIAEIIRGGIQAVSKGQLEAARTITFPSVIIAGERPQLVQVKAVDPDYPLRGRLQVDTPNGGSGQAPLKVGVSESSFKRVSSWVRRDWAASASRRGAGRRGCCPIGERCADSRLGLAREVGPLGG